MRARPERHAGGATADSEGVWLSWWAYRRTTAGGGTSPALPVMTARVRPRTVGWCSLPVLRRAAAQVLTLHNPRVRACSKEKLASDAAAAAAAQERELEACRQQVGQL
eukprot:594664-Prymnesium_polylepis.1